MYDKSLVCSYFNPIASKSEAYLLSRTKNLTSVTKYTVSYSFILFSLNGPNV